MSQSCPVDSVVKQNGEMRVHFIIVKHEILHKDVFGYALSYWSKRQAQLFQYGRQIQDGHHWPPFTVLKDYNMLYMRKYSSALVQ